MDLSNNSLMGDVPEFLSQLPLKSLNLAGNNLSGTVPTELFNRWRSGSLSLSISGNPHLCETVSCYSHKKKNVTAPVVASVAAVFVFIAGLTLVLWRRRKTKHQASVTVRIEYESSKESFEVKKRQFTYSRVIQITNNFERTLGKGGFGTVYYGKLDETEVAVKVLSSSSAQGYKEFQAEVKILLRVHHRNLTALVGYCVEGDKMVLIYEYMAKGNLADCLSDDNRNVLSWQRRLQIAQEAAQGLEYLHSGCKPPIVHRDVKNTNILLNNNFQAKLADFGLSRIFPTEGGSHVLTVVAGTPGFLDPEYYVTNRLTEKSDVFSFGVVLLEIVTSKPAISRTKDRKHISQWVSSVVENGDVRGIVDPRLRGQFNINSIWKFVELAMACVSSTSSQRPTMNQVAIELNECLAIEMTKSNESAPISQRSDYSVELITIPRAR